MATKAKQRIDRLTPEQIARMRSCLNYDPATGVFTRRVAARGARAGTIAGSRDPRGYIVIRVHGIRCWAHRLAWLFETGEIPVGDIDHINRDKSDNRIANLRAVDRSVNLHNRPAATRNTSGFKGVTWHKKAGKWASRICVNYKNQHLGLFDEIEDACRARDEAEEKFNVHVVLT